MVEDDTNVNIGWNWNYARFASSTDFGKVVRKTFQIHQKSKTGEQEIQDTTSLQKG
jgi:hypothetical protein